jgi:hypothetical protein
MTHAIVEVPASEEQQLAKNQTVTNCRYPKLIKNRKHKHSPEFYSLAAPAGERRRDEVA